MTIVRVASVSKKFSDQKVLRDVDLVVPDGSLTAVLGRSGSGKTTLLRVIAGFERPDSGSVSIDDDVMVDDTHFVLPERRRIGYVPQEGALFPHLCVADNIAFGLSRNSARRDRVNEMLDLVGLSKLGHRWPHQLSGGQQQRVALARALAPSPRLLLLDEPFSSLDAQMRAEVRSDVTDVLRKTKTTAVLVTHDQDEALSLADNVAVLRRGEIAQVGSPREVYETPRDPRIAAFVGVANLITGTRHGDFVHTPLGDLKVRCDFGDIGDNEAVVALVRPEELELEPMPSSEGLAVQVEHVEYYGHDALIRLRVLDHDADAVRAVFHGEGDPTDNKIDHLATLFVRSNEGVAMSVGTVTSVRCTTAVVAWSKRHHDHDRHDGQKHDRGHDQGHVRRRDRGPTRD